MEITLLFIALSLFQLPFLVEYYTNEARIEAEATS